MPIGSPSCWENISKKEPFIARGLVIERSLNNGLPSYTVQEVGFDLSERGDVRGYFWLTDNKDGTYNIIQRWHVANRPIESLCAVARDVGEAETKLYECAEGISRLHTSHVYTRVAMPEIKRTLCAA